jgi:outer membrane autotransporter protein
MALAISFALGHSGSANAQQPATLLPLPADHLSSIENFINRVGTAKKDVTGRESGSDGVALKLGEENDLVIVSRRGRFDGIVDGGGGTNILQLDTVNGGELGESRNFNQLHIKRGQWTRTGSDDFFEGAAVADNATLTNRGRIGGQVSVDKRATYRGNGQVHHLQIAGRLEVNGLHGAPRVGGNLELQNTAELAYEVNADGRSETIQVNGTARLGDATLKIVAAPGEYPLSNQYTLITAEKVEGEFGKILNDLAFMTPTAQYNEKNVGLTYARNKVPFEDLANTDNGREFAKKIDEPQSIPEDQIVSEVVRTEMTPIIATDTPIPEPSITNDAIAPAPIITAETPTASAIADTSTPTTIITAETPASATIATASTTTQQPSNTPGTSATTQKPPTTTNAAINALLASNKQTASLALEQLAGSGNANLAKATLSSVDPVSGSMLSAMRQLGTNNLRERNNAPRLAAGNEDNGRVWLQALGHGGKLDRDIEPMQHSTKGLLLGADWSIDEEWRLGLMGGTSRTRLDSKELDGELDSWHLGAYALRQNGPMSLRLGASYSNHDGSTARRVAFTGFSDRPKGSYDASTQQAFAEVGYNLGRANVSIEPFASLGYQRYQRDGYTEKGGAASLKVHKQSQSNMNSTVGLRLAKTDILDNGMRLTPRFSAGWKHTYGDTYTSTRQRLVTGGSNYTVYGVELDRNSLLVDAGLDLGVSANHSVGVGLTGEVGSDSRNHGVMGQWRMAF